MTHSNVDILVSGGGVAGLTAAAVFGTAGFSVICVDPTPPVTERDADGSDLRTTAFLQPAQALLERAGLWDRLAPHAADLQVMRIVDAGGPQPAARLSKDFNASDISHSRWCRCPTGCCGARWWHGWMSCRMSSFAPGPAQNLCSHAKARHVSACRMPPRCAAV